MKSTLEKLLEQESEKKEIDVDLVQDILSLQKTYESTNQSEKKNRERKIQQLLEESVK